MSIGDAPVPGPRPPPGFSKRLITSSRASCYRRVLLDSLAIAFPAAIALGVATEALQRAGFVQQWGVGDVWPFMGLMWVPALLYSYSRYR